MAETRIVVTGDIPPAPYVLADESFMLVLAARETQVLELQITDADSAQRAADLQRLITNDGQVLEAERTRILEPFVAMQKRINQVGKPLLERIATSKARLSAKLGSWQQKEKERLAQIERDRQSELERLRKQKEAEDRAAAETARKVLEATRAREAAAAVPTPAAVPAPRVLPGMAPAPVVAPPVMTPAPRVLGIVSQPPPVAPKSETQKAIERLEHAPAPVVAAKPMGVRFVTRLKAEVIDLAVLPEPFVIRTPDLQKIRDVYCKGYKAGETVPTLAGVKFTVETTSEST